MNFFIVSKHEYVLIISDGFVKVKSIVAVYQEWTEEQVVEVLGNSPLYILKKDDTQDLVIKLKVEEVDFKLNVFMFMTAALSIQPCLKFSKSKLLQNTHYSSMLH